MLTPVAGGVVGRHLVAEDSVERSDVIVVLAAYAPDRALEAADLYREGYASLIVFSSEDRQSDTAFRRMETLSIRIPESHETMASIALQAGVPQEAIEMADIRGESTRSEAIRLKRILSARNIGSLIAVTSKSHTRRVGKIFRRVFGKGVKIRVRASRYDDFDPDAWWRERWQARTVLMEYLKLIDFHWVSFTGREEA